MKTDYRAKNGMRESSLEAHEEIKKDKSVQWDIIIKAMQKYPDAALISKNIAALTRLELDYHTVARRLSEMELKGMIKVVGRCPHVAKRPLLWLLTDNYKTYEAA